MTRVKKTDHKAVRARFRVQNRRNFIKLKAAHEKYILEQIVSKCNDSGVTSQTYGPDIHFDHLDKVDEGTEISNKLRYWAVHHRITKKALNDLLHILRGNGMTFLPKDSRTFMRTPVHVPISTLDKGKMWYNGVKNCLDKTLIGIPNDMSITLDWNVDGFPVAKSSNMQFWPILCSIRGRNKHFHQKNHVNYLKVLKYFVELPQIPPMVIAIWCGASKPALNEFLLPLVTELKSILSPGIDVNGHHIQINFGLLICDTPARAFLKGNYF